MPINRHSKIFLNQTFGVCMCIKIVFCTVSYCLIWIFYQNCLSVPLQYKVVSTTLMILIKNTLRLTLVKLSLQISNFFPEWKAVLDKLLFSSCRYFDTIFRNYLVGCELDLRHLCFLFFSDHDILSFYY